MLSPVTDFGGWWCKREDLVGFTTAHYPSGSKVRQYNAMAAAQPGQPMVVGCAADSAMQIYVAAAAKQTGVPSIVFVPARKDLTPATRYAIHAGATVYYTRPGYMTVVRARARAAAKTLGGAVRWQVPAALADAMKQAANVPQHAQRVVIPTGSGLTAAGVLAGLVGRGIEVVAVTTSKLATLDKITEMARRTLGEVTNFRAFTLPRLTLIESPLKYGQHRIARLPDGTPLDPYYAAKAVEHIRSGDVFWPPGLRPVPAMPDDCQGAFKDWKGPC